MLCRFLWFSRPDKRGGAGSSSSGSQGIAIGDWTSEERGGGTVCLK